MKIKGYKTSFARLGSCDPLISRKKKALVACGFRATKARTHGLLMFLSLGGTLLIIKASIRTPEYSLAGDSRPPIVLESLQLTSGVLSLESYPLGH